jgi:hypothetical protein
MWRFEGKTGLPPEGYRPENPDEQHPLLARECVENGPTPNAKLLVLGDELVASLMKA